MRLFDSGSGTPIVVVPGVTGRWEWMFDALTAIARHGRAIGYSLCGEAGSGLAQPAEGAIDALVRQLETVLERAAPRRAVLCGVSLGGYVALRCAARHPERVSGLILASAPGPGFTPDARQERYLRWPLLLSPVFVAAAPLRVQAELRAALPHVPERLTFARRHLWRVARAPMSPRLMARRVADALRQDFAADCRLVCAPTLVLTGEPALDRIVPVASSREYLDAVPGSRHRVLAHTGHLGVVTRPREWGTIVGQFAQELS